MKDIQNSSDFSVLHVASAHTWRSGEQQVAYLFEELTKHGVRQYILCTSGSQIEQYCIDNNIPFFAFHKRSSFDLVYAKKIGDICESNNIQIVHTHDSHAHNFGIVAALYGNKSRIMVSCRIDLKLTPGPLVNFKFNHPLIGKIICASDKIKQLITPVIEDPLKLVTVYSGIDLNKFEGKTNSGILHREFSLDPSLKIVANIDALVTYENCVAFIDIVELVAGKLENTIFFIIGELEDIEKTEQLIIEKSLHHKIIVTGFRNDIPDILPEVDLFLVTSETEGIKTSVLEAFACAVPVVATTAEGISEIVIHNQTGLVADVGGTTALVQLLYLSLNNETVRNKITTGAKAHLEKFTKEEMALKTLREYHSVIGSAL